MKNFRLSYVYKITNKLNGNIYIGKRTFNGDPNNDNYWGSSKSLKEIIDLLGIENFEKTILDKYLTEEEAYNKEAEYINKAKEEGLSLYNIRKGRNGGKIRNREESRTYTMRISVDLYEELKKEAKERKRSVNFILNEKLEMAYE